MKNQFIKSFKVALFSSVLFIGNQNFAQVAEVNSSTFAGTISELGTDRIIIKSDASPEPISYTYSKTTTYVDETGAPVPMEVVKLGLPATVYYTTVGDARVATKVVVKRAAMLAPSSTTTTTTTTTTPNVVPIGVPTVPQVGVQPVTTVGTISQFSPDRIVIKSESSPEPLVYTYGKSTEYVDETGAPVAMDIVRSGLPATVYYTTVGDARVATKVVVRRTTTTGPTVLPRPTVIETPPTVIKERSAVVTPPPATVVRERPTVSGQLPPTVIKERTTVTDPAPVVREKKTVIEEPATPEVIEKKTTTTTVK